MVMKKTLIPIMVLVLASFAFANELKLKPYDTNLNGNVSLDYTYENDRYTSVVLTGNDLMPDSTYRIILLGKPSCHFSPGDDKANEVVGLKGDWTCLSCNCANTDCDRTTEDYYANKECIQGYLVLDYFVTDKDGKALDVFQSYGNSHFIWCQNGFCQTDFLGSGSYNIVFNLDDGSGNPLSRTFGLFNIFGHNDGGSGGSGPSFSSFQEDGQENSEAVPEFSAISAGIALLGAGAGFILLRKRK